MKTPIKELIDDLAKIPNGIKVSENMKSYFIEKEKQMIIDALEYGNRKGYDEHILTASFDMAEQYYNETFKQ